MAQRDFSPWSRMGYRRPRLLIEDPDRALMMSDFTRFSESGLDVALCSGPSGGEPCPLVEVGECQLADEADIVLMGTGMAEHTEPVAAEHHRRHPGRPVVVAVPRDGSETAPEGCVPLRVPCSVEGQLRTLWRALDRPAGRPAAVAPPPPAAAPWPADPSGPGVAPVSQRWPADPSASGPAPSTADSVWEARLADLLGW